MSDYLIKTLADTPIDQIHAAFVDAFSDYEVKIDMPIERLIEMMKTRDLNPDYSIGCFAGADLVGFIICGFRQIDGQKVCYDGGTGVVKAFQRKGIGEMMLKELLVFLKEKQVERFVLEVLENNTPAIKLYEKHGFRKTRKLECFERQNELRPIISNPEFLVSNDVSMFQNYHLAPYELYRPTWQNDLQSIQNVFDNYAFIAITAKNQMICFGFIHQTKGDIPQIGVLEEWKYKGLEAYLINELAQKTSSKKLVILNVEADNYLGKSLIQIGFENSVNQYEMELTRL